MRNPKKAESSGVARADLGVLDIGPQVAQQITAARAMLGTQSRAQGSPRRHKRSIYSTERRKCAAMEREKLDECSFSPVAPQALHVSMVSEHNIQERSTGATMTPKESHFAAFHGSPLTLLEPQFRF